MSTIDHRESLARDLSAIGGLTPADATAHVLARLDSARKRIIELERQLRVLRGERCEHWVDGGEGERIAIPTLSCGECR